MNKIKNVAYGAASAVIALAPAVASAQWSVGQSNAATSGLSKAPITDLVKLAMYWLLGLVGFLGVVGFVISGILYLTAAGDEDQIGRAKNAMMYSIIGVIVALLGFIIINAATSFLSGTSSTF